jgi:small-conductance mechanosensitive channel
MKHVTLIILLYLNLFSQSDDELNSSEKSEIFTSIKFLKEYHQSLSLPLETDNIWVKRFASHNEYLMLKQELSRLEQKIKKVWRKKDKNSKKLLSEHLAHKETLKEQIKLLGEFGDNAYESLIKIDDPEIAPEVGDPFAIFSALSYLEAQKVKQNEYEEKLKTLQETIYTLEELKEVSAQKVLMLDQLYGDNMDPKALKVQLRIEKMLKNFTPLSEIYTTSLSIFTKKSAENRLLLNSKIKQQSVKLVNIAIIIALFIAFLFFIKYLLKRYMSDTERFYIINKTLNIASFFVIVIIISFNYINNLTYLLTVLGFVSAGIAFAMKDWFMSILGWFVIVIGGYFHIGDRIRIVRHEREYIGDILEISFTRLTLLEDVTLPTIEHNRRAGRIIFIPNNFIFSELIQNYSFNDLKTVWDGIDIMITFESNHKKAVHIARDIARKYAKGYTDSTRKQLNAMRTKYNLKSTKVEPRIFTFIEQYGMKISTWYLTNSFATLTLRSTISSEIIDAFMAEEDIEIAYPTYTLKTEQGNQKTNLPPFDTLEEDLKN